ncbi:MAG TPA: aldehyde dehydrogenase family protein [Anaerolineae bacterium]|nr:aldehyde dehydrogenase family protein [Anaerolineae bacterium]
MSADIQKLLQQLNINETNLGSCTGPDGWLDNGNTLITSNNPTTGDPIAQVQEANSDTYEKVLTAAQNGFNHWRTVPAPQRGQLIRDLGDALRAKKELLGDLISLEMGKIRAEGHGEVQEMIDICDFAVGLSRQLYGLTMHSERPGHRMYEQWHPLGAIGVITAFNFPGAVWAWNAAIAAVCGDTVVWKPSELTPLTAVAIQHICNDVMAAHNVDGIFTLLVGQGHDIGETLINDKRLPLISFTGSTKVGRHVSQTVANRFGRSILELGGNNAIIVAADADLEMATRGILFGAVGTAGQRCTTTRRIIAHKDIAPKLTEKLVNAYKQVPMGNPLDDSTLMGPLVTSQAVAQMESSIKQAQEEGGQLLTGGERRPDIGPNFITPAIMKMPAQTPVIQHETFAPLLYILEYEELDEAMAIHNDVPQGLSSAIFTDSIRTAEAFLAAGGSDCGIANVNIGTSGAEIGGAFGGEKETGGGRESGSDAWRAYMRRQTNTINWSTNLPLAQGITFGD